MKDTVQICATIDKGLRERVRKVADVKKWTFSQCVANILEEYTDNNKGKIKKN